jgi:hypothetical protein
MPFHSALSLRFLPRSRFFLRQKDRDQLMDLQIPLEVEALVFYRAENEPGDVCHVKVPESDDLRELGKL